MSRRCSRPSTASPSSASGTRMSCGTSSSSGSSRRTSCTRRRPARSGADNGVVEIEVVNRSGTDVDERAAAELARRVLTREGIEDGELGLAFVPPEEIRRLKHDHLGVDEVTDVLAFPIDGREELPPGV